MPLGLINNSDELRKLIVHQSDKYNIPLYRICYTMNINYHEFLNRYANVKNLPDKEHPYSDVQLMEIAKHLGITIRSIFVVKEDNEFEKDVKRIKEQIDNDFEKWRESRTSQAAKRINNQLNSANSGPGDTGAVGKQPGVKKSKKSTDRNKKHKSKGAGR